MAPMTRNRANINLANELMATYYSQRASAGLIITEGVSPSPNGLGYARIAGIFSDAQINSWKQVTEAVHEKGGAIFMQLMHCGRISSKINMPKNARVLAPSAVQAAGIMETDKQGDVPHDVPETMTKADINQTIQEYAKAAENAITAGFDGIEFHAANGYLPNQFLSTNANLRTDEYGGSIENRCRFVLECLQAIIDKIGSKKVGIKFSPGTDFNDMEMTDTKALFLYFLPALNKLDLAFIDVVLNQEFEAASGGFSIAEVFRRNYTGLLFLGSGLTAKTGEQLLQNNLADMAVYATLFVSNPDLPLRFATNATLAEGNTSTYYTPGEEGYTDYPTLNP